VIPRSPRLRKTYGATAPPPAPRSLPAHVQRWTPPAASMASGVTQVSLHQGADATTSDYTRRAAQGGSRWRYCQLWSRVVECGAGGL